MSELDDQNILYTQQGVFASSIATSDVRYQNFNVDIISIQYYNKY